MFAMRLALAAACFRACSTRGFGRLTVVVIVMFLCLVIDSKSVACLLDKARIILCFWMFVCGSAPPLTTAGWHGKVAGVWGSAPRNCKARESVMRKRKRMSRRSSRKNFSRNAGVKSRNFRTMLLRGGYRL